MTLIPGSIGPKSLFYNYIWTMSGGRVTKRPIVDDLGPESVPAISLSSDPIAPEEMTPGREERQQTDQQDRNVLVDDESTPMANGHVQTDKRHSSHQRAERSLSRAFFNPNLLVLLPIFLGLIIWNQRGWLSSLFILLFYFLVRFCCSDFGQRIWHTLPRELRGLVLLIRIKQKMRRAFRLNKPIHYHFLRIVEQQPDKLCLTEAKPGPERSMTFAEFNAYSNKYANLLKRLDYGQDDVLALFMENGIDFFAAWLGCSKLGVVTAWINTNLKAEPLAHSIRISKCKAIMTTPTLLPVLKNAMNQLSTDLPIFVAKSEQNIVEKQQSPNNGVVNEYPLDNGEEPEPPNTLNFQSVLCYIYTSGTTGNPKAAIIKHYRYYLIGCASGNAFGIRPSDRLYLTLPMYHSTGGILGTGQVLLQGCSACIRPKFSASSFWEDCINYKCTASQYVGEICRYLLAQPSKPNDRAHEVRLMFGNGLRPEIWKQFVNRFGIKRIGEFYGSTEGNSNLVNIDNHMGSCGFMPIYTANTFLHRLYPIRLLKVDDEGELLKDKNGYCIQCQPGDNGELVGSIRDNDLILRFEGYVNQSDTQKKIIRDCLWPGDTVFTSGDILHWDHYGYLYFKDRRGDTYRWRGENVSTTEVEGVLQPITEILDATVYGVEVPGREGRAGMISCTLAEDANIETFVEQISHRLVDQLASYAIPVFLRICSSELEKTGTFKLKKNVLQQNGFDLTQCDDNQLFYWNLESRKYIPLTPEMHQKIVSGEYSKI